MKEGLPEYLLREKLNGYASPVDPNLLERVMHARREERQRPSGFWWVLPLLLLMAGGAVWFANREKDIAGIQASLIRQVGHSAGNFPSREKTRSIETVLGEGPVIRQDENALPGLPNSVGTNTVKPGQPDNHQDLSNVNEYTENNAAIPSNPKTPGAGIHSSNENQSRMNSLAVRREIQGLGGQSVFSRMKPALNTDRLPPVHLFIPGCPGLGGERRNDWYLEAFIGADMPRKSLSDAWDKSGFAERKDSTEKFLLSYSAGFRLVKNISNDWLLKTGVHYSQFNEKFEYRNASERRITTVITIRTIIRGPGDTLLVRDTSQVEVTGTRVKTTYNRYRNIDIPLLLSYEMRKPGFTIAVNGGVTFNIRSAFKGDMIDTSGAPMSDAGKDASTQLKTRLGLGVYAGLSFIKSVSPTVDVFAEPYYRRYINNQATDAAAFKQYLSNFGILLGIRYNLNGSGQRY